MSSDPKQEKIPTTEDEEVEKATDNVDAVGHSLEKTVQTPEESNEYAGKEPVAEEPFFAKEMPAAFAVITAPKVCPPGYRLDASGKCRRIL